MGEQGTGRKCKRAIEVAPADSMSITFAMAQVPAIQHETVKWLWQH